MEKPLTDGPILRQRFIPIEDCGLHVREAADGQTESRRVDGRPIVFGVRSRNLTPWSSDRVVYEVLEAGCIAPDLIQRSDIVFNINHSTKVTDILGRRRRGQGTLDLTLRESHVESSCELPMTSCANDTLELIKRGDISGMSFAFSDDWEDTENGVSYERTNELVDGKVVWIRHVKKITELYDVAIVTNPAYEQTSVALRELGENILKRIDAIEHRDDNQDDQQRKAEEAAKKEAEEKAAQEAAECAKREQEEREAAAKAEEEAKAKAEAEEKEREAQQRHMVQRAHLQRQQDVESYFIN